MDFQKMPLVRDWDFAISDLPDAIYDLSRTSGYGICTALYTNKSYAENLKSEYVVTENSDAQPVSKPMS